MLNPSWYAAHCSIFSKEFIELHTELNWTVGERWLEFMACIRALMLWHVATSDRITFPAYDCGACHCHSVDPYLASRAKRMAEVLTALKWHGNVRVVTRDLNKPPAKSGEIHIPRSLIDKQFPTDWNHQLWRPHLKNVMAINHFYVCIFIYIIVWDIMTSSE